MTKIQDIDSLFSLKRKDTLMTLISFLFLSCSSLDCPGGSEGKTICLQCRKPEFDPWVRTVPWRREWLPTAVFLCGECHRQKEPGGLPPRIGHG